MKKLIIFSFIFLIVLVSIVSAAVTHPISEQEAIVKGERIVDDSEHYIYGSFGKEVVFKGNQIIYFPSKKTLTDFSL